jgi:hypothetical protein
VVVESWLWWWKIMVRLEREGKKGKKNDFVIFFVFCEK